MSDAGDYDHEDYAGDEDAGDFAEAHDDEVQSEEDDEEDPRSDADEDGAVTAKDDDYDDEDVVDQGPLIPPSPTRKSSSGSEPTSSVPTPERVGVVPAADQDWAQWKEKDLREFPHPCAAEDFKKEEVSFLDIWRLPIGSLDDDPPAAKPLTSVGAKEEQQGGEKEEEIRSRLPPSPTRSSSGNGPFPRIPVDDQDWALWKKKDVREFPHPCAAEDFKKEEVSFLDIWRLPVGSLDE